MYHGDPMVSVWIGLGLIITGLVLEFFRRG